MSSRKKSNEEIKKSPPAMTAEERERQLIALAHDEAEYMFRTHTATSQVVCHYLQKQNEDTKLKLEKLRLENDLLKAKTKDLESRAQTEEFYKQVIDALKTYRYEGGVIDDETY